MSRDQYAINLSLESYSRQSTYTELDEARWWFGKTRCVLPEATIELRNLETNQLIDKHPQN